MKKTMKKILALVLTMLMLLSVAAPVFANTAATVECPEVHSKKNLDEKGITYKFISEHKPERCSDQSYNVYQCNACGVYFADDIVLSGKLCDFEITKPATCTEKGTQKCKVCGYEEEIAMVPHNYVPDKTCGYDGEDVTWTCTVCGDKKVAPFDGNHTWNITVTLEPTCNTKGNAHYVCTVCGFEKDVPIIADATHIGHTWVYGEGQVGGCFKDGTTKDHITAGYYCKDCGVAAEAGQTIVVEGKEVVNETKYTVTKVEHDIDYNNATTSTAPDCTNYGFKFYACKICSYVDVDAIEVLPALGHTYERPDFDLSTLTPDPTKCKADATTGVITPGKDTYAVTCGDCGQTGTIVVNHTIVIGKVVPATCQDKGYTCDYCETCDLEFNKRNETEVDATKHAWVKDESEDDDIKKWYGVELAPTCVTPGRAYTTCKICGAKDTNVTLPATGHNYYDTNGELTGGVLDCLNGVMVYTCTQCPAETEGHEVKVAIPGFDFNDIKFHKDYDAASGTWTGVWDYLAEADCTTAGVALYICSCHPAKTITVVSAPKHTIDQTTFIPAAAATCTTDGHVGFEECTLCDYEKGTAGAEGVIKAFGHDMLTKIEALDPTCTEEGHQGWAVCQNGCGHETGAENAVIPALGHDINLIDDVNPNGNNGTNYGFTCEKYAYNHYGCTRCNEKTTEYWEKYVAATGHNMEVTTEPTCTTDGEKTCTNAWCEGCAPEVVPMLKHIDAEGNVIECVSEDFYCYRCQADAEGKIPEGTDKLSWKESHYDVAVTIVNGICTEYHYELNVCKKCEKEWMDTNIILPDHDTVNAYWVETTPATFDAPGVESKICGRPGCNYVLETREFTRNDIELSFTFENALNAQANVVNSGYLAVKVALSAYKQNIHSVDFSFTVDSDLVELVDIIVPENSVFYNMVFASHDVADADRINVYATVQNAVNATTPRDVEFTGSNNEFITLVFKVADDANTENTEPFNGKAIASFDGITAAANKVDRTAITTTLVDVDHDETIHILGDVNNDGLRNNGKVATAIDVNAIRTLVAENGYVAEADIDKDGEITVFDFELLAQYLVGQFDYADLCANS